MFIKIMLFIFVFCFSGMIVVRGNSVVMLEARDRI